jgi:heme oxygenase
MPVAALNETTLRGRLRAATAQAHARLDGLFGGLDLRSRDGYRRFLEVNAAALLPLESALVDAGVTRLFPDWPARSRRHAILDDLADLDGEFVPMPMPEPLDRAGVLGTMYVLEGSRLGAAYLLRIVESSADPQVAGATAYLRHGAGQHLWRSFLDLLEAHAARLDDDAAAVTAARRTFALFEDAASRANIAGAVIART